MGRTFTALNDEQREWIEQQPLFFVATAPDDGAGHINLSPKVATGMLRVLGPTTVAYLDLHGGGGETITHVRENGRMTLMCCAFTGESNILRLAGTARVITLDDPTFETVLANFEPSAEVRTALRSIIVVEVERIMDSCGFVLDHLDQVTTSCAGAGGSPQLTSVPMCHDASLVPGD